MKIWKLVSGVISIVVFLLITFQSCAVGIVNALEDNSADTSAEGGVWVAFILLVAGITSVCVWKVKNRGADVALIILFGLAALMGFTNLGRFEDLEVWSWWAAICAGMSFISMCLPRKKEDQHSIKTEDVYKS